MWANCSVIVWWGPVALRTPKWRFNSRVNRIVRILSSRNRDYKWRGRSCWFSQFISNTWPTDLCTNQAISYIEYSRYKNKFTQVTGTVNIFIKRVLCLITTTDNNDVTPLISQGGNVLRKIVHLGGMVRDVLTVRKIYSTHLSGTQLYQLHLLPSNLWYFISTHQ